MRALPQDLEIIFEVQKQKSNGKQEKRKISFSTYKMQFFFLFSSLWTPPNFKASNFLIYCSF
jgi:hypothetical protein